MRSSGAGKAWTVLDRVRIGYRGVEYEIGRGSDYYGIWKAGASRTQPLEWWPETSEGWSAAWTRFTGLEEPDAIAPVGRSAAGRIGSDGDGQFLGPVTGAGRVVSAGLLALGVILGVVGLFPDYLNGSSLAQLPPNLIPHVIYLAGWTAGAVLILLGGTRLRMGALLATGMSAVTFGLFFADAGTVIAGGASVGGMGLVLGLLGWLACAAGSVLALRLRPAGASGRWITLGRPRGAAFGPAVLLILAGLGTAVTFAPSWDSFTLRSAAGQTQSLTAGNAFANPGWVIAGDVALMVALAAVVIAAALWRPARYGAALLAGAIIPMAAQAVSALVQVSEPASPAQFGISSAEVSQLGLTISSGLTPVFWIYCAFVVTLMVSCAWMLFTPHEAAGVAASGFAGTAPGAGAAAHPGAGAGAAEWHVARADEFDVTGVRPGSDDTSLDGDDELGTEDEFDSYEEFDSDNPSESSVQGHG
jgi:hypothetical protein